MTTEKTTFGLDGYEDMELSTQIVMREAMAAGIEVTVLDRAENLIQLDYKGHREYVQQATKTSRDSYIVPLIMENKAVSKRIMAEAGIPVPKGIEMDRDALVDSTVADWVGKTLVVKPKSTNYGLGITVLDTPATAEGITEAIALAFEYDNHILIEDYVAGQEFRFLVLEGETLAVLHRRGANVVGDGKHSIQELAEEKNKDVRRGEAHEKPLCKIRFDEATMHFLRGQGLTPEDVPAADERIFLRGNSNISTGGDSIDYTDVMPEGFKRLAEKAATAFGAYICGVDLIIADYTDESSAKAIIEVNYNPHLAMQCYPYEGTERRLGKAVLDSLFQL